MLQFRSRFRPDWALHRAGLKGQGLPVTRPGTGL